MTAASVLDASAEGAVSSSSFVDCSEASIQAGRTSDAGADFGAGVPSQPPVRVASTAVADGVPSGVVAAPVLLLKRHRWVWEAPVQQ